MSTKRNKKLKQISNSNPNNEEPSSTVKDEELAQKLVNGFNNNCNKENKKRKKQSDRSNDRVPKKAKTVVNKTEKKEVKLVKELVTNSECNNNNNNLKNKKKLKISVKESNKLDEITWPDEDIKELFNKIEENIPKDDNLMYSTRVEKLDWNKLIFKNYSIEDCKNTWFLIQKHVRKFRLLSEVLDDAKKWVAKPLSNYRNQKNLNIPKRPLTTYFIFYQKVKDGILAENPGLDTVQISKLASQMYRNQTPEQRDEYTKLAATSRENYNLQMKEFLNQNPDYMPSTSNTNKISPTKIQQDKINVVNKEKEKPPKKTQTPFHLYYNTELNKLSRKVDKLSFKDDCKRRWRCMPNNMKVPWIHLAEQNETKYLEELKNYVNKHPEYKPDNKPLKSVLSKEEKIIKERVAGKPEKPPSSAYNLYTKTMLTSKEIKTIQPKERLNHIANQWKNSSDEEKTYYRNTINEMIQTYKIQYENYLKSLPEDQRQLEIDSEKKHKPIKLSIDQKKQRSKKRRSKILKKKITTTNLNSSSNNTNKRKKRKPKTKEEQPVKVRIERPVTPPVSPAIYFSQVYAGEDDPIKKWKSLSSEERNNYKKELTEKKKNYIVQYEKFLKSLTKEELEAFSKTRQQPKSDDEQSVCSSDSDECDDDCDMDLHQSCFDSSNCSSDTQ